MQKLSSLSVVIMAFNEAANLENVVQEIYDVLTGIACPYEILIVDDGSSDNTGIIADDLATKLPEIRAIHHPVNQGLGAVYRTGFTETHTDFVTFFPADGQFPAIILAHFFHLMRNSDMVLGYLPHRKGSILATFLSRIERIIYHALFGHLPHFQGILMFRRSLLDSFELQSTGRGWAILMEFIIRTVRGGYRVMSIPTTMRPRLNGHSKVNNLATIWANLKQVIMLRSYL